MPAPPPEVGKFDQDPRVHIDKATGQYRYEDEHTHHEFEWTGRAWVPVVS